MFLQVQQSQTDGRWTQSFDLGLVVGKWRVVERQKYLHGKPLLTDLVVEMFTKTVSDHAQNPRTFNLVLNARHIQTNLLVFNTVSM